MLLVGRMPGSRLGHWGSGGLLFGGAYIGRLALGQTANRRRCRCSTWPWCRRPCCSHAACGPSSGARRHRSEWYVAIVAGYALLHLWAVAWLGAQGAMCCSTAPWGGLCRAVGGRLGGVAPSGRASAPAAARTGRADGRAGPHTGPSRPHRAGGHRAVVHRPACPGLHYGFSSVTALLLALTLLWMVFERPARAPGRAGHARCADRAAQPQRAARCADLALARRDAPGAGADAGGHRPVQGHQRSTWAMLSAMRCWWRWPRAWPACCATATSWPASAARSS